jgi:hypothetical protein
VAVVNIADNMGNKETVETATDIETENTETESTVEVEINELLENGFTIETEVETESEEIHSEVSLDLDETNSNKVIVEEVKEEIPEQDEDSFGTLDNMEYIVDISDNYLDEEGVLVGNTSTLNGYSGVIIINVNDDLKDELDDIEIGKSYKVETTPMITMSLPPQVVAVHVTEATEDEMEELEKTREVISNYEECMSKYKDMSLSDIINNANMNYATWTQEQIEEFISYINKKGYSEDYEVHSYVALKADLNGSVAY